MNFPSRSFPLSASFFDIVSCTDKVQAKTNVHLLTAEDIQTVLHLFDTMKQYADECYVSAYTAYSCKGYEYKSHCTCLTLTPSGGSVRRMIAPEKLYGKGSRYVISLIRARLPFIVPPGFYLSHGSPLDLRHVTIERRT